MAKSKSSTYTPAPELPADPELRRRFGLLVAVMAQTETVSGAARALGLSRNHFQTVLHRVIAAMIAELTPKPAGRPAKPEREAQLEAENRRLRNELEAMQIRSEMIERMMTVVGGIASGKTPMPRSRAKKTKSEDPEPSPLRPLVMTMREQHVPTKLCSQILQLSSSTVKRLSSPTKPTPAHKPREIDADGACRVRAIVRATHGLTGAASLSKVCKLPRRVCAGIKRRELREMEIERKARCATVSIIAPAVMRGFDAMHVACSDATAYLLVAADAAIPYRTSIAVVDRYDAASVVAALERDFITNGAPLVLRLDRIACQRTREVYELLDSFGVLALHGPPRLARFYGQLERQNREHRAWQNVLGTVTRTALAEATARMRTALNAHWARPTLDWCTAEDLWRRRAVVTIDRRELRIDVDRRMSLLVDEARDPLRARRHAIESALRDRGLLTINQGARC